MIPSSPRRTWWFIGITCLLYFGPDLLLPEIWRHAPLYLLWSDLYLGVLALLGFVYAPAICRAMVEEEVMAGPRRERVDGALASLNRRPPPLVLVEQVAPFVLTAGLLPSHCQVFVSSALVDKLSAPGLRFLCARAAAHATWRQRMAAFLPVLAFTVLLPDDPAALATWLATAGFLALWLPLHWAFELDADRQAARSMGEGAEQGLRELLAASASPLEKFTPHPPLRWRLRAVASETPSG
jgi:Zn-dependent protease with chaperone function